ncbi:hypothetical protein FRC10_009891, partial [Ceratobasidium sp. 414]
MADERSHLLPGSSHDRRQRSLSTSSHWSQPLRWNLSQPPARTPQFRFSARPDDMLPTDLTIGALEQYLPGLPAAPASRAAVQIIWLLYLIIEAASPAERTRYSSSRQEWVQSTRVKRTQENLENLLLAVWRDFLNGARDDAVEERDEIEELLWYRVGLSDDINGDVVRAPDGSFRSLMLLSFIGLLVSLHAAYPPTPLLLFRPNRALPFAVYIRTIFTQTVTPTLAFFAPLLLALSVFLSLSVADPFTLPWSAVASVYDEHMGPSDPVPHPTPYTTRITIFSFFIFVLISIPFFVTSLVLLPSRHSSSPRDASIDWDTFGTLTGARARRAFVHALIAHAQPEFYPAPLNIARLLWVTVPRAVLEILGRPLASEWWAESVAVWVWRGW